MDEKLDRFRPSLEVLLSVKRQIINAGVDPDSIPMDWLDVAVAAMTRWVTQTPEGMRHIVNCLQFQWKPGLDDHHYEYASPNGEVFDIPPSKIHFFMGAAIAGNPVNPASLTITKREGSNCEGCGITSHCVKDVRNPVTDRIERLCNTCLFMSDNTHIARSGDPLVCRDCTKKDCAHHPSCHRRLA